MTRLLLVLLPLALLGGCVREHLRPVATARRLGSERLACADPEVHSIPDGAWGDDPIAAGRLQSCLEPRLTTLSIPVAEGRLALGTWQGIYVVEHRTRPHQRQVAAHLAG